MHVNEMRALPISHFSINIDGKVGVSELSQHRRRFDEDVHPFVHLAINQAGGGDDAKRTILQVARPGPVQLAGDPVGDQLDRAVERDSACFNLLDKLLAAREIMAFKLTAELLCKRRYDSPVRAAEHQRYVIHQVPHPGHPQMIQARHQPQPSDADKHPDVDDVRLKFFQFAKQSVDVERADVERFALIESDGDRGALAIEVIAPGVH